MALYNLTAGILDQVVTSLQSPAQLDEIQQLHQFLSTDSRVQMLIFSAMTSSSCNYLLSRLSSKRGTALLSFVVVFTVISVLASSTLSSFVFGQPHGWLTNNQVPWAIAVMYVSLILQFFYFTFLLSYLVLFNLLVEIGFIKNFLSYRSVQNILILFSFHLYLT